MTAKITLMQGHSTEQTVDATTNAANTSSLGGAAVFSPDGYQAVEAAVAEREA